MRETGSGQVRREVTLEGVGVTPWVGDYSGKGVRDRYLEMRIGSDQVIHSERARLLEAGEDQVTATK